jgi:hypothetical protein
MVAELSGSGSPSPGANNDHVNVTLGTATLTGSTLNLVWDPGAAGNGKFGGTYTFVTSTGTLDAAPTLGSFTSTCGAGITTDYIQSGPTKVGNTVVVELKDVLIGDLNLDGDVDFSQFGLQGDVQLILANLETPTGMTWCDGDLNHDGDVDFSQFGLQGDVQLMLPNLPSSLDLGHDVGTHEAELVYNQVTGEVLFDVGPEIGQMTMYALEIFGGAAGDFFTHSPNFADQGSPPYDALSYTELTQTGLTVGEDSVGLVLPPGLTAGQIFFEVSPIGAPGFLGTVTVIVPEPSTVCLALLGLLGLALIARRRRR